MQLPLRLRLKLLRQNLFAAMKIGGHAKVTIEESPTGAVINVEGRRIHVPSPLRWKLYKHGWKARLDRLEREYGVGRHAHLFPGAVVLDIGANAGEFAHVVARYGARIHCIEPDPAAHACLLKNIAGLSNAEAHDIAIWKQDGEIDFGLAPERADSSVFAASATRIRKPAMTLARFAERQRLSSVDLVKCDAEGAEPEVLEGAGAFMTKVRVFALDTGPERAGERTHEACARLLAAHEFDVIEEQIGTRMMTYGINRRLAPAG